MKAATHNQTFHKLMRDGVPVSYRNAQGQLSHAQAKVIDFRNPANNRFLVVRELKLTGLRTPNYNRRADLVGFVNGLPLVFIELKAVYKRSAPALTATCATTWTTTSSPMPSITTPF